MIFLRTLQKILKQGLTFQVDVFKNIGEDIETRFDTSSWDFNRLLPKGRTKKVIGVMKDELGRKFLTKVVGLRAKSLIVT